MDNSIDRFCRLCFSNTSNHTYKIINDVMKEVLDAVLLSLNLDENCQHVMCNNCWEKLLLTFNFKVKCLDSEDIIFPYISSEGALEISLGDIYLKEKRHGELIDILPHNLCRFCMELANGKCVPLKDVSQPEMIGKYIPEVNLSVTEDPILCKECFDTLTSCSEFLKNCIEANEEKKENSDGNTAKNSCIKTEEIHIKFELDQDSGVQYQDPKEHGTSAPSTFKNETPTQVHMFKCGECNFKSTYRKNLVNHLLIHIHSSGLRMVKCNEMKSLNRCETILTLHKFSPKDPSEVRMYKCDDCEYKSTDKVNFKRHQITHKDSTEVQMYECNNCQYKCKRKANLKRHKIIHKDSLEVQMYKCNHCGFKSRHKESLKGHQIRHKDPSEVQMYKCNHCEFKTRHKESLKRHQNTHKDSSEVQMYECYHCEFKSRYKESLIYHQTIHKVPSKVQMYKCNNCEFKSSLKESLKRHLILHKVCM